MDTNQQKKRRNALLIFAILAIPAAVAGGYLYRQHRSNVAELAREAAKAEADKAALTRRAAENAARQAKIDADAKTAADEQARKESEAKLAEQAAHEKMKADQRALAEQRQAAERERLRRRFLLVAPAVVPAERPLAMVALRSKVPDRALATAISAQLAQKQIAANSAIFSEDFVNEFVRDRLVPIAPDATFQPADYASGLIVAEAEIEDSVIENPARMQSCRLRLQLRWHDFKEGRSAPLWNVESRGAGFKAEDAHSIALARAFENFDVSIYERLGLPRPAPSAK